MNTTESARLDHSDKVADTFSAIMALKRLVSKDPDAMGLHLALDYAEGYWEKIKAEHGR